MRDPALREKLLAEVDDAIAPMTQFLDPERAFPMGDTPDYEPAPGQSVAGIARTQNRPEMEVFYDALLADDGLGLVLRPLLNYTDFSLDAVREMLLHPSSAWGLGDGGAHCGTTCDASTPTYMLAHWARDRAHDRLPLEWIVKKMTADTASLYGLGDRGVLQPGKVGDVNVIDFDHVQLDRPVMVHDLPGDARRFVQRARGYRHDGEVGRGHPLRRRRPGRASRPVVARRAGADVRTPTPGFQIIRIRNTTTKTLSVVPAAAIFLPIAWSSTTCGGGPPAGGGPCSISASNLLMRLWPGIRIECEIPIAMT